MIDQAVIIESNRKINGKYYKLVFQSSALSRSVQPGQFVNIKLNATLDPFLRRPLSYYRTRGKHVEFLYEILGRGTAILASKRPGETLWVLGPLGKPFTLKLPRKKKRVLVGGGVGVPPLVFLAEQCRTDYLLIGIKSKEEVLPPNELAGVRGKILYSTNDGSYGAKGFVTVLLKRIIAQERIANLFIQTCGPKVMMEAVMDMAAQEGIQGEVSLDETMACGVGACLGCMVKTKERGWVPSCTEGPVFPFDDLDR